jgi:hypothetical protein
MSAPSGPRAAGRTTNVRNLPSGRLRVSATPDDFGANVGSSITGVGALISDIAIRHQQEQSRRNVEAAYQDASTQLSIQAQDIKNRKGELGASAVSDYAMATQDVTRSLEGLGLTDFEMGMLEPRLRATANSYVPGMMSHAEQQSIVASEALTAKGQRQHEIHASQAAESGDQAMMRETLRDSDAMYDTVWSGRISEGELSEMKWEGRRQDHLQWLQSQKIRNPSGAIERARDLRDEEKITADDYDAMIGGLQAAEVKQTGTRIADDVLVKFPRGTSQLEAVREAERRGSTAEESSAAAKAVKDRWSIRESDHQRETTEMMKGVVQDLNQISMATRNGTALPTDPEVMRTELLDRVNAYAPSEVPNVDVMISRALKGRPMEPAEDDLATLAQLDLLTDEEMLQLDPVMFEGKLKSTTITAEIIGQQELARQGFRDSVNGAITEWSNAATGDTKKRAKLKQRARRVITHMEKTSGGGFVLPQDVTATLDNMSTMTVDPGFFSRSQSVANVPDETLITTYQSNDPFAYDALIESFKERNNGRSPTDAETATRIRAEITDVNNANY